MTAFPDFAEFFAAVHGYDPYKWQIRLAKAVLDGAWPDTIAAPTGAGKTAVIDIAVWHLAAEAARLGAEPSSPRAAPTRIVFAVNRRVVVDQAYERAKLVADRLCKASNGSLRAVRDALASQAGDDDHPLHVEQLRGGLPLEDDWARTPIQPTVLCTTIDQLGSRLLFRGYGVSGRTAPIHAGLLGEDALIVLDEAHLSDAFSETLCGVNRWRTKREFDLKLPWRACRLTATPRADEGHFALNDEERAEEGIAKRLRAGKRATLSKSDNEAASAAGDFARAARDLAGAVRDRAPVVAIIVNRVSLARAVFEAIKTPEGAADTPQAEIILLTGRSRPVDRDALVKEHESVLTGKRQPERPLYVVATQCIEAGADFDFDAMVTQIAPLDALIQRFGRLARGGNRTEGEAASAIVLAPKDDIAAKTDDPIYGGRMKKTWDFLCEHSTSEGAGKSKAAVVQLGPNAIAELLSKESAQACMTEHKPAPFLRAADCEFYSMTSPRPHPEPELTLFLHGEITKETDVNIVWRADLVEADLECRRDEEEPRAPAIVEAMRPLPGEALAIPLWAAKAWLSEARKEAEAIGDVVGLDPQHEKSGGRKCVRARAGEYVVEAAKALQLRPGDTLVVPSSYGGCDRFGWAPKSIERVTDLADLAAKPFAERRIRARLHPGLWANIGQRLKERAADGAQAEWPSWSSIYEHLPGEDARTGKGVAKALKEPLSLLKIDTHPLIDAILALSGRKAQRPLFPYALPADEGGLVGCILSAGVETVETGESERSSLTAPETLDSHRSRVAAQAQRFGRLLPAPLCATLEHAGLLHDDGKADLRFQTFLRAFAGDALPGKILAKSGAAGTIRSAWERAGLSEKGWRHEVLSTQMAIARVRDFPQEIDAELAIWLIGTHHGQGRPFFAHDDPWDGQERTIGDVALGGEPGPHRLSFEWNGLDWATLFVRLKRRYGVWGLAYLEAALRLADHRASEEAAACQEAKTA